MFVYFLNKIGLYTKYQLVEVITANKTLYSQNNELKKENTQLRLELNKIKMKQLKKKKRKKIKGKYGR